MRLTYKLSAHVFFFVGILVSGTVAAQPLALPSAPFDSSAPQIATVSVDGTSDPAGHTCCVIAPPSELEVFLFGGSLVIQEPNGTNAVPWIDLAAMAITGNSEFYGESIGTVAGFSNIKTTVSGTIEENAIFTTFTIGADGGLPTGQPLVHNISILPGLTGEWFPTQYLSLFAQAGLRLDFISQEDIQSAPWPGGPDNGVELFISMEVDEPEEEEGDADWWLLMMSEDGEFYYFDLNTGQFESGLEATFQGPLTDIPEPISVLPVVHPPSNNAIIFFGVDRIPNNQLDLGLLQGTGFTVWFN